MRGALFFVLVVALAVTVSANVLYSGESIVKNYGSGEQIKGKINISFNGTSGDALVKSNFAGGVKVKELLGANGFVGGTNYNCVPQNCEEDYNRRNSVSGFNLQNESVVGLSLEGQNIQDVRQISFRVASNAPPSCFKPMAIELFGRNDSVITSNSYIEEQCFETKYGCFGQSEQSYQQANVPRNGAYCEKIKLSVAPAYKIGANLTKVGTTPVRVNFQIYTLSGTSLGQCAVTNPVTGISECVAQVSVNVESDYLICVNAEQENEYKIRTETNTPCGTGNFGDTYPIDYEIFAKAMKFSQINMKINDSVFQQIVGESLNSRVGEYLSDRYNNICTPYCVLPVKFSGSTQDVTLSEVKMVYDVDGAQGLETNTFYTVDKKAPKISSGFLSLDLFYANFTIPQTNYDKFFKLSIEDKLIFQTNLSVVPSFSFDITPKFVAFGQEARFVALVSGNVSSSTWNFGDGVTITSQNNQATHRYLKEGQFTIEVSVNKGNQTSTRSFVIVVGDAKEIANTTILEYERRIANLSSKILKYDSFIQTELNKEFDATLLSGTLQTLKAQYNNANSSADYQAVMLALLQMKVPKDFTYTKKGVLEVFATDSLNLEIIEEISGRKADNKEQLKNAVANWMSENYLLDVEFEDVTGVYDSGTETILTKFKIIAEEKNSYGKEKYLVIGLPVEQLIFKTSYGERSAVGGTYIALKGGQEEFEFIIKEDASVDDLKAYVSPSVVDLGDFEPILTCNFNKVCEVNNGENRENCPNDCRPWGLFIVYIVILLFVMLIVYIIVQEWYKRKYESSLFKDKDQLYNLINFIYNARRQGLDNDSIRKKLSQAGWLGEQVSYALRKIDGKRTGMFEIPIFKIFENKKVNQEIAKRQGGNVDARFIKRPELS